MVSGPRARNLLFLTEGLRLSLRSQNSPERARLARLLAETDAGVAREIELASALLRSSETAAALDVLRRNEDAFKDYEIRARRFAELTGLNTGLSVFGARWPLPVYLSAVSSMGAFHPDGEAAVARAAAPTSTP